MLTVRRSKDRGHADHGWLDSRFSFSFAEYFDEKHMGFGPLRVINEDKIDGGTGFGPHPHRDMEIITYVVEGSLQHQDSMGNTAVVRPGEVQRMSAGTGVVHSEQNPDPKQAVHLLQIWIIPKTRGIKPGYGQKDFTAPLASGDLVLTVSRDGRDGSIAMHQDAEVYVARPKRGATLTHKLGAGRSAWVQVVKGELKLNDTTLSAGDGAALTDVADITMNIAADSELILFNLPQA